MESGHVHISELEIWQSRRVHSLRPAHHCNHDTAVSLERGNAFSFEKLSTTHMQIFAGDKMYAEEPLIQPSAFGHTKPSTSIPGILRKLYTAEIVPYESAMTGIFDFHKFHEHAYSDYSAATSSSSVVFIFRDERMFMSTRFSIFQYEAGGSPSRRCVYSGNIKHVNIYRLLLHMNACRYIVQNRFLLFSRTVFISHITDHLSSSSPFCSLFFCASTLTACSHHWGSGF